MFFATRFIGAAALLSGFAAALPQVAVSGTPVSPTSQTQTTNATSTIVTASVNHSSSGKSGSGWASQTQALTTQTASWTTASGPAWTSQAWTTSTPLATAISYSSSHGYGFSSSTPSYGSGSSSWSNQNYNSCVQQCVASFGGPSATSTPPTATSVSGSGSPGSGSTYTVIVAPTQGVLRYVPFAVNASVGDTIQFKWGANNHTVTKSSSLTPCNKTSDNPFSSGEQNQGFVFTQVVNDTNPTFFYCGTPTHCGKGMFGIINPPNALGSPTSASDMIQSLAANNSAFAAYANYTNSKTAGNTAAAGWGSGINVGSLPSWAQSYAAENIMYTRNFLAVNSEVLQNDGSVNLSLAGSTPWMYPQDITSAINSTGTNSSTTSSSSPLPSASSLGSPASTSTPANSKSQAGSAVKSNAAISTSSSKVLFGLVVGFATFMMV